MQELAGNLASKKELLTGMRFGIALKMKDSLLSRSSLLMCQMSWHLQNRNNHQLRKQKLPQLRVQQPLLHLKLMLSQKSLKVRMPRLLKMEQHMIKMRTSQQKVLRTVHLPAVLLDDMDQESNKDHYFSGPGEFGLNPIRTGSSQGGGFSQKSRPFTFDDSVPSTPLSAFNSGYSPPRYKDSSEPSFDTFSRFDSFRSTQDTGFFPQPEALRRFDSMHSSGDFDQGNGFPTFDDIPDPFGSSAPFRSSLDSQTPRRDSDPFGSSGPFRTSLDSQTPRRESDFFGSSAAPFRTSRGDSDAFGSSPFRTSFDGQTSRGDSDAFGSSPFRTSFDSQTPRRDSDPFGSSGPFRTSLETPRKDSDHWSAF